MLPKAAAPKEPFGSLSGDHQVGVLQPGSADRIARAVADRERRGGGERGGVEPSGGRPRREIVRVGDAVRALDSEAERREIVGGLRDGHRLAGLHAHEAGDAEAVRQIVDPAG